MKHVKVWILGAALGSFAGGVSVGSAIPRVLAGDSATRTPEYEYAHDLAQRYGLTAGQERRLLFVLQNERDEKDAILRSAHHTQLPPAIQNRLMAASRSTEQRIKAVLNAEQRARYERESRPTTYR